MIDQTIYERFFGTENSTIFESYSKALRYVSEASVPICGISGGSGSDIILDIISNVDFEKKVRYYYIYSGFEYSAAKEHICRLEDKYGIEIMRIYPKKPLQICVNEYGTPFLSMYVTEQMMRLQAHGFKWEDEPLDVLMKKYPNCKTALQWWCNAYYVSDGGIKQMNRFSISRNRYLKEFIIQNPPDFKISNKCCYYRKKALKELINKLKADIHIIGKRGKIGEEAVRCSGQHTVYSPIFYFTDEDRRCYDEFYGIKHSRCYTDYGMKRTGCPGCPLKKHFDDELAAIRFHEAYVYRTAVTIFAKSYEYTRKYREFVKMMKLSEKNGHINSEEKCYLE